MDRQKKHHNKLAELGFQRVTVWVPSDKAERLKKYAARLRKQHLKDTEE